MPTRNRWASIFRNQSLFWIDTDCGFIDGNYRDPNFDPILLPHSATDQMLGNAIRKSLSQSRWALYPSELRDIKSYPKEVEFDDRLHPIEVKSKYNNDVKNIMNAFGFKYKKNFFEHMRYCKITESEMEIQFKSSHHEKLAFWSWRRDGIPRNPFENVTIPVSSTLDEIGAAARLALSRCTG